MLGLHALSTGFILEYDTRASDIVASDVDLP